METWFCVWCGDTFEAEQSEDICAKCSAHLEQFDAPKALIMAAAEHFECELTDITSTGGNYYLIRGKVYELRKTGQYNSEGFFEDQFYAREVEEGE